MKRMWNAILALLLCLSVLLPAIPVLAAGTADTVIEAEDQTYTIWNRFTTTQEHFSASGGYVVGGGNAYDNPTVAQLEANPNGYFAGMSYVAFTVEAPADGEYAIKSRYQIGSSRFGDAADLSPTPYMVYLINGKVYTANFTGKNYWLSDTEEISVSLKSGRNTIYLIPLIGDLFQKDTLYNWANVDCLYVDSRLTPVEAEQAAGMRTLEAEDKTYAIWNRFNNTQEHFSASGGYVVGGGNAYDNPTVAELEANPDGYFEGMSYVAFTVSAPSAGDYAVKARYQIANDQVADAADLAPTPYMVLLVNGKVYKANFTGKNYWLSDTEEVSVALKAGENTIYLIPLIGDLFRGGTLYDWANVDCLYVDSRLTPVAISGADMKTVEAEDGTYATWNLFTNKQEHFTASGGYILGGANATENPTVAQLQSNADAYLSKTAYVSFTVKAPKDGSYTLKARYQIADDQAADAADLSPTPYMVFLINGKVYKANFTGKNYWLSDTEEISVSLKAGNNTVCLIPLVADLYQGGALYDWANVDCLYMDGRLTAVADGKGGALEEPSVITGERIEAEDQSHCLWNGFNSKDYYGANASGDYMVGGSHAGNNIYLADLKPGVDLNSTAYLYFRLVAPADGEYTIGLRYAVKNNYQPDSVDFTGTVPYATFFINDSDVYTARSTTKNGWIGDTEKITVKLKKGVNEVICIPLVKDIWDAFGKEKGGYANVDCLYIDSKLTADKVPTYSRIDAINAQYHGCVPESGRLMREDWQTTFGNNMTFANLTPDNVDNVPYVKYTVYAEAAGTYRVGMSFLAGGDDRFKGDAFIGMSINDGAFTQVPFVLDNGNLVHMTYLNLELQEGENTILLTTALADFMYLPKFPSQDGGAVMWVDHMYLLIPDGLTAAQFDPTPKWEGDEKSNVGDSLLSVWGEIRPQNPDQPGIPATTDPTETTPGPTAPQEPSGHTGALVGGILGGAAAAGAAAGIVVLLRKKRKAKPEA